MGLRGRIERAARDLRGGMAEFASAGHFYSPIPDQGDLAQRAGQVWRATRPDELVGIALDPARQLAFLERVAEFAKDAPDWRRGGADLLYRYDNPFYGPGDALYLMAMLRDETHGRVGRVIEVGSGWTTAVMLDTSRRHRADALAITCIEPYPERLLEVLGAGNEGRVSLRREPVQQTPQAFFEELGPGDILFIDSSHVSKCGSDVNHLVFQVLPRLAPGVRVHVHDVFYPFEYPRNWVLEEGRAFNEDYLLRAFLTFNTAYEILAWNSSVAALFPERFAAALPDAAQNAGASIWLLRK